MSDEEETGATDLPGAAQRVADEYPDLWKAVQRLGEVVNEAGPLDARTRRLINLAFAIASNSEGATHSHTRRALAEGALGWPHAIRGLTWAQDLTRPAP